VSVAEKVPEPGNRSERVVLDGGVPDGAVTEVGTAPFDCSTARAPYSVRLVRGQTPDEARTAPG